MIQMIPEQFVSQNLKGQLQRTKQIQMIRTIHAQVLNKSNNEWNQHRMIKEVKEEKRRKKNSDLMQRQKEIELLKVKQANNEEL
mmetsp:Transcript_3644/g.6204  ORF Transcript_3644/g.6204 Transcript_3644/m.6204 type:complete len:84 (-) Transcript_3644:216-467(-)